MPRLTSFSQLSLAGVGITRASGYDYWISTAGDSLLNRWWDLDIDSSNDIVVVGDTNISGTGWRRLSVGKYDSGGQLLWAKNLDGASSHDIFNSVAVDSSDNIYATGRRFNNLILCKFNSAGTLSWTRLLDGSGSDEGQSVKVNSSGDVIVSGKTTSAGAGNNDALLAKYNSSGTLQWQRTLGSTGWEFGNEMVIDSSDNIFMFGSSNSGTLFFLAKYNNSGTLQWQKTFGPSSSSDQYGMCCAIDSSSNIITASYTDQYRDSLRDGILIVKLNSSGTVQWSRHITAGGTTQMYPQDITTDSSDNIYVIGYNRDGDDNAVILKYNSSGTLQWQRSIDGLSEEWGNGIISSGTDKIVICGLTTSQGQGNRDAVVAKLPADGSGTGTYGSLVYGSTSYTSTSVTLTSSTSSLTSASSSIYNDTSVSPTVSTLSWTELIDEVS